MNDTSNPGVGTENSNNETQTTVVEQTSVTPEVNNNVVVEPTVEPQIMVTPVVESQTTVTPVVEPQVMVRPTVEPVVPSTQPDMNNNYTQNEDNKEENKDENKEEKSGNNFPLAIIAVIILFIVSAILYYNIALTPKKVFESAFDSAFDKISETINELKDNKNKESITIDMNLLTDLKKGEDSVNGHIYTANIDADMAKQEFAVQVSFFNNINDKDKNIPRLTGKLYTNEGNIYVTETDSTAVLQFTTTSDLSRKLNISVDRFASIISAIELVKDQIVDEYDTTKLDKKLAFREVGGQTTLAVEVTAHVSTDELNAIWTKLFRKDLDDKETIDLFSKALGTTEEETKSQIESFVNNGVSVQNIDVNLFMNLANTKLVGLEVNLDNYYFEINYLNGVYDIVLFRYDSVKDKTHKNIDLAFTYDEYHGDFNGYVIIDNDNTYTKTVVIFDKLTDDGTTSGNTLDFEFYDSADATKPFAKYHCELDIKKGDDVDLKLLNEFTDSTVTIPIQIINDPLKFYYSSEFNNYIMGLSEKRQEAFYELSKDTSNILLLNERLNSASKTLNGFMYDGGWAIYHLFYNKTKLNDIDYATGFATKAVNLLTNQKIQIVENTNTNVVEEAEGPNEETIIIPATGVTVIPTTKTLEINSTFTINVSLAPENTTDNVTFATENANVATVDATGKVKAVGVGTTNIVVSAGTASAKIKVVVTAATSKTTELSEEDLARIETEITNELTPLIFDEIDKGNNTCTYLREFACTKAKELGKNKGLNATKQQEACDRAKTDAQLNSICEN